MDCNATYWRNNYVAIVYSVHGALYLPFYVPCLMVLLRQPLIDESCYKLMGFMGIVDLSALTFSAFIPAIMSAVGTPLCDPNVFIIAKLVGAIANALWGMYAFMCIVLAISRVMGMYSKTLAAIYFGGHKAWYWCAASVVYFVSFAGLLCTPTFTTAYNSRIGIMVFDPIEAPDHNLKANQLGTSKRERSVTIQSITICLLACATAYGYVIVNRITDDTFIFVLCNILWQMTHGPIIWGLLQLVRLQPMEVRV